MTTGSSSAMTALTAGWLTVSPSSTTARTSALVATTQSSEVAAISSGVGRVAPTIGGASAASAMPWVLKKRSPAELSGHFGIAAGLGLLPPLHTCAARAGLGFAPNRAELRRSSKSARDLPTPCRRCPFFRLALPTESDRTPPASAPQEPGGDGGLRQGDGGALQDGCESRSRPRNAARRAPSTTTPFSVVRALNVPTGPHRRHRLIHADDSDSVPLADRATAGLCLLLRAGLLRIEGVRGHGQVSICAQRGLGSRSGRRLRIWDGPGG